MESAEELRTKARRLIETANNLSDSELKKELADRALQLSVRAEAIANSMQEPEIIEPNIRRYQSMLAGGLSDASQRKIIEEMLADAQTLLANLRKKIPTPNLGFGGNPCPHINAASSMRTSKW